MATFNLSNRVKLVNPVPNIDSDYGPYDSIVDAETAIPSILRKGGKTVGIWESSKVVEYWWEDDAATTLVKKIISSPEFIPSEHDLDEFTNIGIDPFAHQSEIPSGVTNLSYTPAPTNGTVTSDTGTDATIPLATFTNAGLLSPVEKKQLTTNTSTGVFTFTGLVKTSSTQFSIGAATGIIVDSGLNYQINYAGSTGNTTPYLATADSTFVLIKNDNTILLQATFPTLEQRRENIYLGKIVHPDRTTILNVNNTVDFVYSPMSALRDLWSPLKLINDGILVTPNGANLKINTSAGTLFGNGINFIANTLSPNSLNVLATVQSTFMYRTQVGGTFTDTTNLDPSYYDVAGVRTLIPGANARATNQRIYLFPTGQLRIQYGQQWYSSLTNAISGLETETFIEYPNHKDNAILIGIISLVKNASNLTDITDARFNFVSKFGELSGGTGGLSTTNLQQAYLNSITPEIETVNGAVSLKQASGADTDNVFEVLNGGGTTTASINGNGGITTTDKVTTFTGNETSTTKFPVVKAIIDYFTSSRLATILGFTPADDALVVHKAGVETITGLKTFTDLTTFQGVTQTGASANGVLNLLQTWNTTGVVSAIKLNIINTVSGINSKLIDLRVGNNPVFYITTSGGCYIGGSTAMAGNSSIAGNLAINTGFNAVSGDLFALSLPNNIYPTSGTANVNLINISPIINQTGGANGITRGLYINPLLTSAYDFRAIEVTGGKLVFSSTITAVGTTGAQTINKISGKVNAAAGTNSLVVTNSLVTMNSIVMCQIGTNDMTARITSVVESAGSFMINYIAPTAETVIKFKVIN